MSQRDRRIARPPTIALIGPDGSGKSTISRAVVERLGVPARSVYMGVNLEASDEMLPTTRVVLVAKRRRGGRPDLTAREATRSGGNTLARTTRSLIRMFAWIAEEQYRARVAAKANRAGMLIVFDRHFFCDYYGTDVRAARPDDPPRALATRIHGAILRRWYPRPDLAILLDAPAEVLYDRKHEGTIESIERLRENYLSLAEVLPAFEIVDANRPLDAVIDDVVDRIEAFAHATSAVDDPAASRASGGSDNLEAASGHVPEPIDVPEAAIGPATAGAEA